MSDIPFAQYFPCVSFLEADGSKVRANFDGPFKWTQDVDRNLCKGLTFVGGEIQYNFELVRIVSTYIALFTQLKNVCGLCRPTIIPSHANRLIMATFAPHRPLLKWVHLSPLFVRR